MDAKADDPGILRQRPGHLPSPSWGGYGARGAGAKGATRFWLVAALALGVLLVAASALFTDTTDAAVPAPETVVAETAGTARTYPPALKAALAEQRASPDDAGLARDAARLLIAAGRDAGDSRLVGAAIGILRPFLDAGDPQTLSLAADARQYQHDFPGALALLDRAAAGDPGDANILLTRATILTVLGDYAAARADCRRLGGAVAFLCIATTHVLTTEGPAYRARLETILSQPGLLDPALRRWALGLVGEIARHMGDDAAAEAAFRAVLRDTPGAQREALMLADLLLDRGDAAGAMAALAASPGTDGVLIRRTRAARALGRKSEAADLAATLDSRIRLNLSLGLTAHAREEAMYFLDIAPDPAGALDRAQVNWALQHEIDDAELLIRAARAAGRPDVARPVADWMAAEGVVPRASAAELFLQPETRADPGP